MQDLFLFLEDSANTLIRFNSSIRNLSIIFPIYELCFILRSVFSVCILCAPFSVVTFLNITTSLRTRKILAVNCLMASTIIAISDGFFIGIMQFFADCFKICDLRCYELFVSYAKLIKFLLATLFRILICFAIQCMHAVSFILFLASYNLSDLYVIIIYMIYRIKWDHGGSRLSYFPLYRYFFMCSSIRFIRLVEFIPSINSYAFKKKNNTPYFHNATFFRTSLVRIYNFLCISMMIAKNVQTT